MCGIGSITMSKSAPASVDLDAGANALLKELKIRGRDASGIATISADGRVSIEKAAVDADDFIAGRRDIPGGTRAVAVHTRAATQGHRGWMRNNHPVECGKVFVCHNGVVWDDWLERRKTDPRVDTYAIAHELNEESQRNESETPKNHAERLLRRAATLDGSMALQIGVRGMPFLVSAKLSGSPLLAAVSEEGVQVTASTYYAVKAAMEAMKLSLPTIKIKVTRNNVESEEDGPAIYQLSDGMLVGWDAGEHFESYVKLDELEAPADRKKPEPAWKSWTKTSYGRGSNNHSATDASRYAGMSSSDIDAERKAWSEASQKKFYMNSVVTLRSDRSPWHGIRGVVTKVIHQGTVTYYEVTFDEYETTHGDKRKEFKAQFTSGSLMPWFEYLRDERDSVDAKLAEDDIVYVVAPDGVVSVEGEEAAALRPTKRELRAARRHAAKHMRESGFTYEPGEFDKIVEALLQGLENCELCDIWTDDGVELEEITVCRACAASWGELARSAGLTSLEEEIQNA